MCVESSEWMKLGGKAFFCFTVSGFLQWSMEQSDIPAARHGQRRGKAGRQSTQDLLSG